MGDFSKIQTLYEFTNDGVTYGAYFVKFKGSDRVFIRNGKSVGAVGHYYSEPVSKCIGEIREDVKEEFFKLLGEEANQ